MVSIVVMRLLGGGIVVVGLGVGHVGGGGGGVMDGGWGWREECRKREGSRG